MSFEYKELRHWTDHDILDWAQWLTGIKWDHHRATPKAPKVVIQDMLKYAVEDEMTPEDRRICERALVLVEGIGAPVLVKRIVPIEEEEEVA